MYDIFYYPSEINDQTWQMVKEKYPSCKKLNSNLSIKEIQKKSFTKLFWLIFDDLILNDDIDLNSYRATKWDDQYIHVFQNGKCHDGILLIPKLSDISDREFKNRFFTNKKLIDITASEPVKYDKFLISNYSEYELAFEKSKTNMFWGIWDDVEIESNFNFEYQVPYCEQHITHIFKNGDFFDGICLFSKNKKLSKKEIDYRFFNEKKEIDIVASTPKPYDIFEINVYEDYIEALEKSTTNMFWVVWEDVIVNNNFKFDYQVIKHNQHITHIFKNGDFFDGICLFSKNTVVSKKEFEYRFFNEKKEIDICISKPRPYDRFVIDTYEDYLLALKSSKSQMFWGIWNDLEIESNFNFEYQVPYYEQHITHIFKNDLYFDGICLFSKNKKLSKKEIDYRFFIEKKEIDICISKPRPYDRFVIDTYEDYLLALKSSKSQMFWGIWKDIEVIDDSKFSLYFSHHNSYDRKENHNFKNFFKKEPTYTNGIVLFSKDKPVSSREIKHRFIIEKKEHDFLLSKTKPYDIVFISYNEPNADENYKKILMLYPNALRVDKVKGIHQAHISAAEKAQTDMFWVVDGDAEILDSFNFDYEVSTYEKDIVHVWRSQNPINELIYGYGGVKLLPRELTKNMKTDTTDMTTSISKRFKAMPETSNVTVFNTDPFNTWKSAFRECVKLSSKIIDGQVDEETSNRLDVWCSVGENKPYGKYAIIGANMGKSYGYENSKNPDKLKLINDFEWLEKIYNEI